MRLLLAAFLCLTWTTSQAQTAISKIAVDTIYMPRFTIKEASDAQVHPIGIRWMLSDYDRLPIDFGLHAYAGYGEAADFSFGLNLAYVFARPSSFNFKIGLSLSEISLKDVKVKPDKFGPHVGDVNFSDFGTQFKPYLEWEWNYSHFSSLFVHTGYRIVNGDRTVVTAVESEGLDARVTDRDDNFFYSASGFEFGAGISINFYYHDK